MKILVTGGSGYIGRNLVESLCNKDYEVSVLTRGSKKKFPVGVKLIKCDLIDIDAVKELYKQSLDFDIVFHCAGELKNKKLMRLLHVIGTQNLLDYISDLAKKNEKNIHWVQLSSVGVYGPPLGKCNAKRTVTEDSTLNPVGLYEITKLQSDRLVIHAASLGLIDYTIIRPSNVFSIDMPNQSLRALVRSIKNKLFFYIGKPSAIATYIHINDVTEMMVMCLDNDMAKGEVFNISNDCLLEELIDGVTDTLKINKIKFRMPEFAIRLLVSFIGRIIKLPLSIERVNALVMRTRYPLTKLQDKLKFTPKINVPDAMSEFVIKV